MSSYSTPSQDCPYCGKECHADWVDNGVGMVQCGPYHCFKCGASEIGPEMKYEDLKDENGHYVMGDVVNKEDFTKKELEVGWYEPESKKISPYANTVNGELINHVSARKMYNIGLLDEKEI